MVSSKPQPQDVPTNPQFNAGLKEGGNWKSCFPPPPWHLVACFAPRHANPSLRQHGHGHDGERRRGNRGLRDPCARAHAGARGRRHEAAAPPATQARRGGDVYAHAVQSSPSSSHVTLFRGWWFAWYWARAVGECRRWRTLSRRSDSDATATTTPNARVDSTSSAGVFNHDGILHNDEQVQGEC